MTDEKLREIYHAVLRERGLAPFTKPNEAEVITLECMRRVSTPIPQASDRDACAICKGTGMTGWDKPMGCPPKLVFVPQLCQCEAGRKLRGSTPMTKEQIEQAQHLIGTPPPSGKVTVPPGYALGEAQLVVAEYRAMADAALSHPKTPGGNP